MMGFGQLMGVEPEEDATIGPRVTRGSRFADSKVMSLGLMDSMEVRKVGGWQRKGGL
jgi:hypothetical protein